MRIGFDLDGIFVEGPPLIPKTLIGWLYKGPQNHELRYRFPSTKFEQKIRRISHNSIFRPKVSKNADFINKFAAGSKYEIYLISSRYSFLEDLTLKLLEKYNLKVPFVRIYLNTSNRQPHIFKKEMIKKLRIDIFIDDDIDTLEYLKAYCPNTKLFFYGLRRDKKGSKINHIDNLTAIENI